MASSKAPRRVSIFDKFAIYFRAFAMTLHFYLPKACDYVRSAFENALPNPRTIGAWYSKIGGKPGFTSEVFAALQIRVKEVSEQGKKVLMFDEMAIYRNV
jgi:hypothetical protein